VATGRDDTPQPHTEKPLLRNISWHPVLLALYPSLHLLARNTASVRPAAALVSLVVSVGAALIIWLVCGAALKDRGKGALLTALAVVVFFAHGHVLRLVGGGPVAAWLLIAGGSVLLAGVAIFLARWRGNSRPWNRTLDVVALALTLMVLVPIVSSELRPATNLPPDEEHLDLQTPLGYLPDIYVIILDGFGRADKLREIYDVDLTQLQTHLTENDFQIATRANANYSQTSLSLACLLNSDYVTELLPREQRTFRGRKNLNRIVQVNRNVSRLRRLGYQLVTLTGGSELAVQADPDVNYRGGALNEFQTTLLATTPLPLLATLVQDRDTSVLDPFVQHREGVLFQLRKLPHVMAGPGPKLVFAHIMTPHPPFVIGPGGAEITPSYEFNVGERYAWDGYVEGYGGQATWLAGELQQTVDGILEAARRPPVILIMGDHGPASRWVTLYHETGSFETEDPELIAERMAIFLALHLPPGSGGEVYPELTPVNIFPLIFERCFGEPARLKPDLTFFSTYDQWSLFTNVDHITRGRSGR
jgi:hypothetical protein